MNKYRKLTCIGCPMGCQLCVSLEAGQPVAVSGNQCGVGARYGIQEVKDPKRILTTTVAVDYGEQPCVAVKSSKPLPKDQLLLCVKEIASLHVAAPVQSGQVIVWNIRNTGIDLIASQRILKKGETVI